MGDTNHRRAVVQIGHQLNALLVGDGVVFVLAGRGLTDEFRLTRDVPELREGGDEDCLGGGRDGVVVQEGVGSSAGDTHIIRQQAEIYQAQIRGAFFAQCIGESVGPVGGRECRACPAGDGVHPKVHGEFSEERRHATLFSSFWKTSFVL